VLLPEPEGAEMIKRIPATVRYSFSGPLNGLVESKSPQGLKPNMDEIRLRHG
jgi:hypothetical protein